MLVAKDLFGDLLADRLQPDRIPARREPGQHLLHRHLAQDLRRGEQLIGRNRQLPGAVGGPYPRAGHRHPPSTQGHRPAFMAVTHRRTRLIVAALRAGQLGHVGLHQRRHHLQAGAHRQRQQTLLHVLGDLGHGHTDPLWNRGHARVHGLNLATLLHGGPLAVGVLGGTPDTYHTAGLERGTATSTSTKPGTTSRSAATRFFRCGAEPPRWCGDITEIPTDEGKLCLATVLDLFSRKLLTGPISEHPDAELACNALKIAAAMRGGRAVIDGVVFRTDRGSTYTARHFTGLCEGVGCASRWAGLCHASTTLPRRRSFPLRTRGVVPAPLHHPRRGSRGPGRLVPAVLQRPPAAQLRGIAAARDYEKTAVDQPVAA